MTITSYSSMINALSKIRMGSLLIAIAYALSFVGSIVMILTIPTPIAASIFGRRFHDIYEIINSLMPVLIIGGLTGFIILMLWLIAIYAMIVPGVKELAKINREFSTSSTLIRVGYVWGLILIIISILLLLIGLITSLPSIAAGRIFESFGSIIVMGIGGLILLIGLILAFIGFIGLIILAFNFHSVEQEGLYLAVGILLIIGLVISIAGLINIIISFVSPVIDIAAWILMFVALGKSIEKYRHISSQQPLQPPVQV